MSLFRQADHRWVSISEPSGRRDLILPPLVASLNNPVDLASISVEVCAFLYRNINFMDRRVLGIPVRRSSRDFVSTIATQRKERNLNARSLCKRRRTF